MPQSNREELANSISHGIGFIFGLIMLPFLPYDFAHNAYRVGFLFMFLSSTIYHTVKLARPKQYFQKIDHIAIYFMIAGSYTPFIFECLVEDKAWFFFSVMWGIALLGTIFKLFFTGKLERISLMLYLGMGWMLVFIIKPFWLTFPSDVKIFVAVGGLLYSGGVYFYANDEEKYYHFIWHLFVLGGALAHFYAIYNIIQ